MSEPTVLPHSEETERAVLASVFLAPQVMELLAERLDVEDFHVTRHKALYKVFLELNEVGTEIDIRTAQSRLEARGAMDMVGGLAYLAGLDLDLPDLGRIETYVEIVKETSLRRILIRKSTELIHGAMTGGKDATESIAAAEEMVLSLGAGVTREGFVDLDTIYEKALDKIDEGGGTQMVGLPTGFYDWDKMTQGLTPGTLTIVAGRPGMGKTSFALNVAQHVAIREGKTVGMFSLEMSDEELALRILASEADIPFSQVRSGHLSQNQWEKLMASIQATHQAPLYVDESSNPTLIEITAKARRLQKEKGLALLIVDYIGLMHDKAGRHENRQNEISAISRGLKELAKDLKIPVMALSQLSRQPERRTGDHRPQLADLRDSGSLEQDADMVCGLYRDEMYNKDDPDVKGLAELIVLKQRNGPTGTVELVFLSEITTFRSLDTHHLEPSQGSF